MVDRRSARVWHQRFTVAYDYPVVFTRDLFEGNNSALVWAITRNEPERRHRVFTVVDAGVEAAWPRLLSDLEGYVRQHGERLELVDAPLVLPGGEAAKNDPAIVADLQRRFWQLGMDRHSFALIIGGGAVLDAAGYAATTTHRGLRVVRVPTTVLAQNDAGIGVKTGVNAFETKNFLGTFAPPFAVINDINFIETLSARDRAAGIAEAIKVALIRDFDFFEALERDGQALAAFEPAAMESMIRRCAELHLQHIASSGDAFESGSARPLDFGHWAAHKLESLSEHNLRHGEAVAIGMALDSRYSVEVGLLGEPALERICRILERVGLRPWHDKLRERGADGRHLVLGGLSDFREHLGGDLTVTLLAGLGRGVEVHDVDEAAVVRSLEWLEQRHKACASTA